MSNYIQETMSEFEKCQLLVTELNAKLFQVESQKINLETEIEFLDKKIQKFQKTRQVA